MKAKRDPMRAEYDFDYSKAGRGKYHKRLLKQGSNVVVLNRDVAKEFPDSASVNRALRAVIRSKGKRARALEQPRREESEGQVRRFRNAKDAIAHLKRV